jgi:NTE family protein
LAARRAVTAAVHVPALAADGADEPRRALILAGGGIRVAYQAGVLVALEEAGLRFHHADGTSGGVFNAAMLLSGISPEDACRRWRALDVRSFASLWPPRRLLRGPPYPALGSSAGIRSRVFPALGVDPERIRAAAGLEGTFNVCDFEAKECVAVPHTEVDLDVLTAGVSLPVVSPAVRRDGRVLVDAVWIKDANLTEALRRGADELWLVWCIGNHGVYRDGAFQQYVHMIEIAANGALQAELAEVRRRGVRLHVIRPRVPLPLDPDFFLGRIDASTLIAMGYRDAARYLDAPHEDGVAPDQSATRMKDPVPGIAVRERFSDGGATLDLTWEVDELDAFAAAPEGTVVGTFSHPAVGRLKLARDGRFGVAGGEVTAELRFGGRLVRLRRPLGRRGDGGLAVEIDDGSSLVLRPDSPLRRRAVQARGVGSAGARLRARLRFARWYLRARA